MTKIINATDGARLYELDKFHSMLSDDYLSDRDNHQTKFIFEQFFKDEKKPERLSLLNISYSLPALICGVFSDYVGEPKTTLPLDLDPFISAFIWGGLAVFRPSVDENGEFVISCVYPDEYLLNDDGSERLLTYFEKTDSSDKIDYYVFEEIYTKNLLERRLFKLSNLASSSNYTVSGEQVNLDELPQTRGFPNIETFKGIERSPLVKVHNRILKGNKYGTSEIRKIRSLISSIEIEAVNIQDQFLKHLQAKLALPLSSMKVNGEGMAEVRDLEAFAMESGDILPSYISNSNPLIDKSFDQIEDFLRQICAITSLPTEFMGLKDGGSAESADTKKIRLVSFIKKVEKIRSKFEKALNELEEIRDAWVGSKNSDEPFVVAWPSIFPDDPQVLAAELQTAQDAKLISNLKSIMRFQNLNQEDAIKEQAIINKERETIDTDQILN